MKIIFVKKLRADVIWGMPVLVQFRIFFDLVWRNIPTILPVLRL
jgi:hypothetical protein